MDIHKIDVEFATTGGFRNNKSDGVRHVKVLPYLSVVQAVEGQYGIALGNQPMCYTGSGGFFVAPSHVSQTILHQADPHSGYMRCRWVFLTVKLNDTYWLDDVYRFPTVLPREVQSAMNAVFDRLFSSKSTVDNYLCHYEIIKLLLSVGEETEHPHLSPVHHAVTFIKAHYREKITVHTLARCANLSDSRFHAVFKREMGVSPMDYLHHYRLSLAADRLLSTSATVAETAFSVGINDVAYFCKLFKKVYNLSPTAYRKYYLT